MPEPGPGGYPSLLYREGSVLFALNVETHDRIARSVLSRFMDPGDAGRFIDRTDRMYVRLYEEKADGGNIRFEVIARGAYPRRIAGFALNRNGWTKKREPSVWWQADEGGMQIAFPTSSMLLASSGGMESVLSRVRDPAGGKAIPDRLTAMMERSALFVYGESPEFSGYFDPIGRAHV